MQNIQKELSQLRIETTLLINMVLNSEKFTIDFPLKVLYFLALSPLIFHCDQEV